jgi:hypothetical protein
MATTTPQTKAFANNRTRLAVTGGDGRGHGLPNIAAGNRVMSVVLPFLATMQSGGPVVARTDATTGTNPLIRASLAKSAPVGVNLRAFVQPWDGTYGLPQSEYFVRTPVNGF